MRCLPFTLCSICLLWTQLALAQMPSTTFPWKAQHDCELELRAGTLWVKSTGNDPYFTTSDVPAATQPLSLQFRMKSQAEGGGQLFWQTKEKPTNDATQQVKFSITHNALWHEYRVPFEPEGTLSSLRLDPGSGPGEMEIESLRLVAAEGMILKQWLPLRGEEEVNGNATIRGKVGDDELVITTTSRLAGAIHSLTWKGKEFIDSVDHGRQLAGRTTGWQNCCFKGL